MEVNAAEFERRSLESLLRKSKGTSYEATLKRIVALKLRGSGSDLSQSPLEKEQMVDPQHYPQHRPYAGTGEADDEAEGERGCGRGRERDRADRQPVLVTPSGVRRRRSLSQTSTYSVGSMNGSERSRCHSANRYLRGASKERTSFPTCAYDDRWGGRNSCTPPPRPFIPALLARASSERIMATTRASETFDERLGRSVNNYYIRQAFSCFRNDGPGQYTKTLTVPYHQRFAASNTRKSVVGTFGTEKYNDSFMSKTFARTPMKRDPPGYEPAVGQYSPSNAFSNQFNRKSSKYATSREERWDWDRDNSPETDAEYTSSSMATSRTRTNTRYGPDSGYAGQQRHEYQPGHTNQRERGPGPPRSVSTPGTHQSNNSRTRTPNTAAIDRTPTEQRLRHLLRLIALHNDNKSNNR